MDLPRGVANGGYGDWCIGHGAFGEASHSRKAKSIHTGAGSFLASSLDAEEGDCQIGSWCRSH